MKVPSIEQSKDAAVVLAIATYLDRNIFRTNNPGKTLWDGADYDRIGFECPCGREPEYSGILLVTSSLDQDQVSASYGGSEPYQDLTIDFRIGHSDLQELISLSIDWSRYLSNKLSALRFDSKTITGYDMSGTFRGHTFHPGHKISIIPQQPWSNVLVPNPDERDGCGGFGSGGVATIESIWRVSDLAANVR